METVNLSLLRGICQTPAYVAHEQGFFSDEGLTVAVSVEPTASMVPGKLAAGQSQFAVIPWTRAAVAEPEADLVVVCGSGREAAIVVRAGLLGPERRSEGRVQNDSRVVERTEFEQRLTCVECGSLSDGRAEGWRRFWPAAVASPSATGPDFREPTRRRSAPC